MNYLPRNVKIDWLRFQIKSEQPSIRRQVEDILGLPFEKYEQKIGDDTRTTNVVIMNKVWHEAWQFQGSMIGSCYPDPSKDSDLYRHFVDLNGSTIASINIEKIFELIKVYQYEDEFIANRIDIALDFAPQSPRLSNQPWEIFLDKGLLFGYRTVKRIFKLGGNNEGSTVYLGSRESEVFVRIYDKIIDDIEYDRLEIEFKRSRAELIMKKISECNDSVELIEFLNDAVCGQITLKSDKSTDFFRIYKYGGIRIAASKLHLDIERSIAFIERNSATLAMIQEHMGPEKFDKFIKNTVIFGKCCMKPRHRNMIKNAKFLGFTTLGILLIFLQTSGAIAGNLSCPAPVPLSFQMSQKFPIDIVQPTASEQAYFNNIGDGCFQINSGLEFQKICLPGMIVNALKPFVIMGLGIKFIFSD